MAALVALIVFFAVSGILFGGYIGLCMTIKRIDKRGALRREAPSTQGQRVLAFTGMHAARWPANTPTRA